MSAITDFLLGDIVWVLIFWFLIFPFLMLAVVVYLHKINKRLAQIVRVLQAAALPQEPPIPGYLKLAEKEARSLA